MNFTEIRKKTEENLVSVYQKFPISLDRGKGTKLADTEGKIYTDFLSGIAVNALGYSDPEIVRAIKLQAEKLTHTSNLFYNEAQANLLYALLLGTEFSKGFLANSGAEANEAAVKIVRKYFYDKKKDKYEFITLKNSFHGRTMMTATLTGQEKYSKPFAPLPEGVRYAEPGDIADMEAQFNEHTAAVMLEVIQGEGGVCVMETEYLRAVEKLCRKNGAILIIDEIQTGLGRTGTLFAYEQAGIHPDIVTLAKALGGGLPLGAMLATDRLLPAFTPGVHGTTFGGNPLACASGLVLVNRLRQTDLISVVKKTGAHFMKKLEQLHQALPDATGVPRGRGLMLGLPLAEKLSGADVVNAMLRKGYIINCAGQNTLRFLPPYIITTPEIDLMTAELTKTIKELSK